MLTGFLFLAQLLRQVRWLRETARHPLNRASCDNAAKTQKKSYHTASAGFGCPATPERRGRSWSESGGQSPVSAPRPLPEPEIRRKDFCHPPAMSVIWHPTSGRSVLRE